MRYHFVLGWCKAGAGLGGDIGQFSLGVELGYSTSSIGDPAVLASLENRTY